MAFTSQINLPLCVVSMAVNGDTVACYWCVFIVIGVCSLLLVCVHCYWCVFIVIGVCSLLLVCVRCY